MTGGCCERVQCCRESLGSVSYFYRGHISSSTRNRARVLEICELVFRQPLLFSREALRISFLGSTSGCRRTRKSARQSVVVRRFLAVRSSQLGPRCARFHHALRRRCVVGRNEGVRSWLLVHALLGAPVVSPNAHKHARSVLLRAQTSFMPHYFLNIGLVWLYIIAAVYSFLVSSPPNMSE